MTKHFAGNRLISGSEYLAARKALDEQINEKAALLRGQIQAFAEKTRSSGQNSQVLPVLEAGLKALDANKLTSKEVDAPLGAITTTLKGTTFDENLKDEAASLDERLVAERPILVDLLSRRAGRPERVFGLLPTFVYFSNVDLLEDEVTITSLAQDNSKYGTFRNLLGLVGLDVALLASADMYTRRRMTRGASAVITGFVNKSWNQEKVRVNIDVDGDNLIVSVEDDTGAIDPPSRRSQGFQYFLAFYINFMYGSQNQLANTVILLDDPGVYLHADGQQDLLTTMEEISKSNQIIIATHSPFLVDTQRLERILLAEKKAAGAGSSISRDFNRSGFEALQAVRAAVGMTLGKSLFFDRTNVILEGPSDRWLVEGFIRLLSRLGRVNIQGRGPALLGVGGAEKMPYFVHLLSIEGLRFFCLLDHDPAGRRVRDDLLREFNLDESRVRTLHEFCAEGTDGEIEDLIDEEFYLSVVNRAYASLNSEERTFPELTSEALNEYAGLRAKRYDRFFRERGLGSFDKEFVARYLHELIVAPGFDESQCPQALERFTGLIGRITAVL